MSHDIEKLITSLGNEIRASTDEQYLLGVEQQPSVDNINQLVQFISDPVTVGTGDKILVAWRTSTAQTLLTYDGRTSITLGARIVGASGGSSLTVENEGSALATAATTLDFVGAGVTASGTGAEKTITIPGVTASDLTALGVVGPILIADDHSTPLVFADLLQTEDGDDLLYADIGA